MNKLSAISACLALLLLCDSRAAEPLVVFPQGDFSCTVKVVPHSVPKRDPVHPEYRYPPVKKEINIVRSGDVRRDTVIWSDNSISELWDLASKGIALWESNNKQKDVYFLHGDLRDDACPKLLQFNANSVAWITEKALDKQSTVDGGTLHYEANVIVSRGTSALYQAWIDSKTLLPLKFDDGQALYIITFFKDVPARPLVMPAKIQAELNRWQADSIPHPHI